MSKGTLEVGTPAERGAQSGTSDEGTFREGTLAQGPRPSVPTVKGMPTVRTEKRLREESDVRVRLYVLVLLGNIPIALLTLLAARVPGSEMVGAVGIVSTTLALLLVRYVALRPELDPHRTKFHLACVLAAAAAAPLNVFYGVFMSFVGTISLILLIYAQRAPLFWASLAVITIAAPHLAIHVATTLGALPDIGVLTAQGPLRGRILSFWGIASSYGLALMLGQILRRRNLRMVADLEEAARQVALREVLLREAHLELENAAGEGREGRFSDQRLGSFVLGYLLARGGMGEIYEAHHVETGEAAAVKVIRRPEGQASNVLERFVREAKIAASIQSPYVARVLEISDEDAIIPYIAMERLYGADLGEVLRDERELSQEAIIDLVVHVANGLMAAHEHGVVHRDIKPRNLFRCHDGTWKILDFGVARLAGSAPDLTGTGLVGTPAFMAPEQIMGEEIDHRVDVHALGLVAYRALTGRPAYAGEVNEILHQIISALPPRPSELAPLPVAVDAVLRVAIAKSPNDRFADAAEVGAALSAALEGDVSSDVRKRAQKLCETLDWSPAPLQPGALETAIIN